MGYKQNMKPSSIYSKGIWENKCNTCAEIGTYSQKEHRPWQPQKVYVEVLWSRYFSSQCKTQEHRTSKSFGFIRKVERQLLNERVRSINNTIELSISQRDTCIGQLKSALGNVTLGGARPSETGLGKPNTKTFWNSKKWSLPGCGTKPQVATQKAEVARTVGTGTYHTVATQTIHQLTAICPHQ